MNEEQKRARILQEIAMCRDDERNSHSMMIQVVGVAGAILGVLLGASFFKGVEVWLLSILSDLVFLTAYFFIIHLGIENVLRYHYLQDLEKKLCEVDDPSNKFIDWMSATSPITTRNILHLKCLSGLTHYVAYMGTPTIAFMICILISSFLFWQDKNRATARVGFVILVVATLIGLFLMAVFTVNSKKIYEWSKQQAEERKTKRASGVIISQEETREKQKEIRRGIIYYIYPKTQDIQKLAMIVLGAVFALYYQSTDWNSFLNNAWTSLADFGIVFFAMEYCLYAARYQWNDIRGVSEDEKANQIRNFNRGLPRLFDKKEKDVKLSSFIIGIRLLLWLATLSYLIIVRNSLYWSLIIVSALIIVTTICYESARANEKYDGIINFVGVGYPLRFWTGFLAIRPSLSFDYNDISLLCILVVTLFALYPYGIMAATLPWTYFVKEEKEKGKGYSKCYYGDVEKYIDALRYSGFSVKKIIRAPWGLSGFISILMFLIYLALASITSGGVILKIKLFSAAAASFVLGTFLFLYFLFDPNFSLSKCLKDFSSMLRKNFLNLYEEKFLGSQTSDWMKR